MALYFSGNSSESRRFIFRSASGCPTPADVSKFTAPAYKHAKHVPTACTAQNLADYIYYYGSSPNDSQLMSQYEQVLRNAVQTNNWSQVQVVRGQPDPVLPNPPPRFFPPGP